jgi:superfamily II DNA or RNA helicase
MSEKVEIEIEGAWARLKRGPVKLLDAIFKPLDPKRYYNPAYRQHRWDGRVPLHVGREFPAGLVKMLTDYLDSIKVVYTVLRVGKMVTIDLEGWSKSILPGITLWDHQDQLCRALLTNERGVGKSPTGSGKTECMAAIALFLFRKYGWRTLIVTSKKGLARQNAARMKKYCGREMTVGQCGDGVKTIGDVTCATAQTLLQAQTRTRKVAGGRETRVVKGNKSLADLIENTDVLFFDEAHHTSSESWYEIGMASKAKRRYGVSGTPLKDEELQDLRLLGVTGPVVVDIQADVLIGLGLAARPKICMVMSDDASGEELDYVWIVTRKGKSKQVPKPYPDAYAEGVVENETLNDSVARAVAWLTDRGRRTLVICRRKEHYKRLDEQLTRRGVDFASAWGATATEERDRLKTLLADQKLKCILATTIFDEGEDVPTLDAIVLAEGVKSKTNAIQRIGRGMRKKSGGNDLWVVDFVPTVHPTLVKHGSERAKAYEAEGYEVLVIEKWPDMEAESPVDLLPFETWESEYATIPG